MSKALIGPSPPMAPPPRRGDGDFRVRGNGGPGRSAGSSRLGRAGARSLPFCTGRGWRALEPGAGRGSRPRGALCGDLRAAVCIPHARRTVVRSAPEQPVAPGRDLGRRPGAAAPRRSADLAPASRYSRRGRARQRRHSDGRDSGARARTAAPPGTGPATGAAGRAVDLAAVCPHPRFALAALRLAARILARSGERAAPTADTFQQPLPRWRALL